MKKLLFSAAVCSLFMISCNNEMESDLSNVDSKIATKAFVNNVDFQIVNYNGEDCFQFRNDSTYNETITKLAEMSNEEVDAFFSGFNFISQQKLMEEADKEQEAIVDAYEKDPSQPWPYQQIAEFKQKYDDVFMFNPYDSTDFVANYKVQNPLYRNLANKQGLFLIGDSVINCSTYTLNNLFGSSITTYGDNIATGENNLNKAESKYQIPGGDYVKVRAIPTFIATEIISGKYYKQVGFDYLSQKKKVLWKKHHGRIHLRLTATGSGNIFEVYNITAKQFENRYNQTFMLYVNVYDKLNAKDGMALGHVGQSANSPEFFFRGDMEIWSDEIPESNKGESKIDIPE